uniref:Uncharacterized protein n=1 Tax=Anguilla anguilla TaxID=7936 RepID=A0A0E9XUF8_ANGAN
MTFRHPQRNMTQALVGNNRPDAAKSKRTANAGVRLCPG